MPRLRGIDLPPRSSATLCASAAGFVCDATSHITIFKSYRPCFPALNYRKAMPAIPGASNVETKSSSQGAEGSGGSRSIEGEVIETPHLADHKELLLDISVLCRAFIEWSALCASKGHIRQQHRDARLTAVPAEIIAHG